MVIPLGSLACRARFMGPTQEASTVLTLEGQVWSSPSISTSATLTSQASVVTCYILRLIKPRYGADFFLALTDTVEPCLIPRIPRPRGSFDSLASL